MSREQVNVIVHPPTRKGNVTDQTFELDNFRFELSFLHTNTVWHVTGWAYKNGHGDGSLINLVLPGFHTQARIVDLVEKIIVEHVSYRK